MYDPASEPIICPRNAAALTRPIIESVRCKSSRKYGSVNEMSAKSRPSNKVTNDESTSSQTWKGVTPTLSKNAVTSSVRESASATMGILSLVVFVRDVNRQSASRQRLSVFELDLCWPQLVTSQIGVERVFLCHLAAKQEWRVVVQPVAAAGVGRHQPAAAEFGQLAAQPRDVDLDA